LSDDEGEPRPAFLDRATASSPAAAQRRHHHRQKPLALAPSTAAQTLSRSLLAHEDAAAGALVGALAGSALGVAYEPEHHTRLPRMFPDGIRDFWTVDLPERPRGRAALENPIVAAVPGRAALEYAAMVACARSLARCGGRVEGADLLDALVDCRRGIAASTAAGTAASPSSPSAAAAVDASYVVLPPTPRRFSSPYTDLATEAVSTAAATGAADPRTLATLAEAAMARGFARTAPTASDRPHRREFGAHDFGAATFLGPPLGLAYQDAALEELAGAVDEACAATHPAQSGRDGAAIVAAAVGWLARERRRRRQEGAGGGGDDGDANANGPRALAAHLLESADALRLGSEARDVLSLVAGALGVVGSAEAEAAAAAAAAATAPRPRHPLGSGGSPLDNIVPPALDGAPGRWRVFWASPTWAALSGSAARVAGGSFATTGARLAGVAVLLFGAAGFGSADKEHGNAPAQAVSLAVTMGGACSATASVVGAMAGALHGVGWVPARWWGALEDQLPGDSARATGRAWDGVGKRAAVALGGALGAAAVAGGGGHGGEEQ
jgi:ADP-ribosylglycohydrolase